MPVTPSLLDKFLREVAPGAARERLAYKQDFDRIRAGGYSGAIDTRFRSFQANARSRIGSEDYILGRTDRQRLRLECRDLFRNNEIVRGIVDRFVDYAIWKGIRPKAQTSNLAWNQLAQSWWNDVYTPTCDVRQLAGVTLITHQKLLLAHRILDGELGYEWLANGQFNPVEPDRIATPDKFKTDPGVTEGIRQAKKGIVTGYYICDRKKGSIDTTKSKFVKRENFRYCFRPGRVDQLRGVPDLAPVLAKLRDYDETDTNILIKVKSDAMQQFKRTRGDGGIAQQRGRGSYLKTDSSDENQQRVEKEEWGRIHNMRPGEDLLAFESKTPNTQVTPYLKHQLQTIAAALNIPYEFMMLIFTEGSFSSQRAALIHAKHTFVGEHDWVINVFLNPLWNWRIAKAMKHGELPQAPIDAVTGVSEWWKKEWTLPFFDWVDPGKQAKAEQTKLKTGSTSLDAVIKSQGREPKEVFAEQSEMLVLAIDKAAELNKLYPDAGISWRDFMDTGADVPKGPLGAGI